MKKKQESFQLRFARSLAMGVIISMLLFYSAHVFGEWTVEKYFATSESTGTIVLHNKCAVIGHKHTLRPNTNVADLSETISGTK